MEKSEVAGSILLCLPVGCHLDWKLRIASNSSLVSHARQRGGRVYKLSPALFPKLNCLIRMKIPILKVSFEESVFLVESFEEGNHFSFDFPLKARLCPVAVTLQIYT